jgi:peptidoglycan/LPS O-acetylase OafA/YrhL
MHQVGWAGVDLFFAISGLLICSRLIEEEKLKGRISLRDFYIRRLCRIFPAAYLFLAAALALGFARQIPYSAPATLASALMIRNYWGVYSGVPPRELYTDHFWSLSVEEHFYLILPAVLVFVRRRVLVLSIMSGAAYLWFFHWLKYGRIANTLSSSRTDLRIHALLIPAILAILLTKPAFLDATKRWLQPWLPITLVVVIATTVHRLSIGERVGIVGLIFPFMVASTMIHPRSLACRVLEWQPIRYVGRLSYGIYLWQQIFLIQRDTVHWPFSILQTFPWNYMCLFACSVTSYYLLEKPLIRLGHRLAPPATPGRLDIAPSPEVPNSSPAVPPDVAIPTPRGIDPPLNPTLATD